MKFIAFRGPAAPSRRSPGFRAGKKWILLMRITRILLTVTLCAAASESVSQSITITAKNATVEEIISLVERQANRVFIYKKEIIRGGPKIRVDVKDMPVQEFLSLAFKDQPFTWFAENQTIVLKRLPRPQRETGREDTRRPATENTTPPVTGRLLHSTTREPLAGATITVKGTTRSVVSDEKGMFAIDADAGAVLVITYVGYEMKELKVVAENLGTILLKASADKMEDVVVSVSTGYKTYPKERSTGSFTHVDNRLFNRAAGTDVISRLEAVAGSLAFIRKDMHGELAGEPELRIRGMSTIYSESGPLIVLDNFPYEGSLNAINPNDIEDITILKDAAAASIWGARAGNGVIVIKTKQARYRQALKIGLQTSVNLGDRPNLYYDPALKMSSGGFLESEQLLFSKGFYEENDWTVLSPAVEAMIAHRDGRLSEEGLLQYLDEMRNTDIRKDALRYLYQPQLNQQYAINVSGGSESLQYYISGGYDANQSNLVGNSMERYTFNTNTAFKPNSRLEIQAGLNLTILNNWENGIGISGLAAGGKVRPLPYLGLKDTNGEPSAFPRQYRLLYVAEAMNSGLLDWQYRPLQELELNNIGSETIEARFRVGARYTISKGIILDFKYQHQRSWADNYSHFHRDSYYARDFVNRFTQADGSKPVPEGAIWQGNNRKMRDHSLRGQLEFDRQFGGNHEVSAIAGTEVRDIVNRSGPGYLLYGMDEDILEGAPRMDYVNLYTMLPQGNRWYIPGPPVEQDLNTDRFISYYANAAYSYKQRYTLSGSIRLDQSNLFGVKTNQRGVPLWSLGAAWTLSKEPFYNLTFMPLLNLRATIGESGNINKTVTAFPIASYGTDNLTGLPRAILQNTGNPSLRWERVRSVNFGIDFAMFNNRLSGSIEFYRKLGLDLLGDAIIDPTTGVSGNRLRNRINYADTRTTGWDVEMYSRNISGIINWSTNFLFSYVNNKVIRYDDLNTPTSTQYVIASVYPPPVVGLPQHYLYSYPWIGLDGNGDPLVHWHDQLGTSYSAYINGVNREDLVYHGPAVPTIFGSVRNTVGWRKLSFSANISFKAGHYFRRSALSYSGLYNLWEGHIEYEQRWKNTGDEMHTNVPGHPRELSNIGPRDQIYQYSEITALKGDNVRLEDIRVGYEVSNAQWKDMPFKSVNIYLYARNLGILWRANKFGLDPDYPNSIYPPVRNYAITLQAVF